MTKECFKQIRVTTLNKMSKEEIQQIHPFRIKVSLRKSNISDMEDSIFYYLTSEQLAYFSAELFSYVPNNVLKKLLELHKDETQDMSICTIHYSSITLEHYTTPAIISGNAIRIANGLKFQREKEEIQMEIDALREVNINEKEINGLVPFKLVMARLQDAYSPCYDKIYSSFKTIIINNEKYVNKKDVLEFLNNHKDSGPEITEIPCLSSLNSLINYPVDTRRAKISQFVRKYGKNITLFTLNNKRFFLTEEIEMLLAISRNKYIRQSS